MLTLRESQYRALFIYLKSKSPLESIVSNGVYVTMTLGVEIWTDSARRLLLVTLLHKRREYCCEDPGLHWSRILLGSHSKLSVNSI